MSEEGTKYDKILRKKKVATTTNELLERKLDRQATRPTSLELETDWTNTETKLVVLDFLSTQLIEHLTARNAPENERKKVSKSASDGSSHEPINRKRYAKLAKSARPLRKQYSLRLRKDLDEYLRQRGKSLADLPSYQNDRRATSVDETQESFYMHQRSYTEGDADLNSQRKMSDELKKGIKEFNTSRLKHVADDEKTHERAEELNRHRPEKLDIPFQRERRISPVLSPESQVAARLELISQDILNMYPLNMSKVSLQNLTYEKFSSTARKLLEKYPGGWTRVALVCYFARELALEDESTDEQLELLVEFSSKFISETSAEWIASQGGWGALDENNEAISTSLVRQKLQEEPDIVDGILDGPADNNWVNYGKYGVAALAIGVTVVYQMVRGV